MKKNVLLNCFLALVPIAAFFVATTGDSVVAYNIAAQEVYKLSYFALVPGASVSFLTPLAGMLTVVATVLALVLVLGKKTGCIPWLKWICMIAACVAVGPLLLQDEVRIVPNFVLPFLMMMEFVLCILAAKVDGAVQEETGGQRLG